MKTILILVILTISVLTSLYITTKSPLDIASAEDLTLERSLDELIYEDLEQVRRIIKDGNITRLDSSSTQILYTKIINQPRIPDSFAKDYKTLKEIIQETVSSIQKNEPKLSKKIARAKENTLEFDKRLKSIGLSELNTSWRSNQKIYRNFLREPDDKLYKEYQTTLDEMRQIISELYLEDDDERDLFAMLDHYKQTIKAQYHVYHTVGLHNIKQIKPLVYSLKEQMQLNPAPFKL